MISLIAHDLQFQRLSQMGPPRFDGGVTLVIDLADLPQQFRAIVPVRILV
jgi:hypothetical protein